MLLLKKSQFWLQGRHLHSVPKSGFFDCPHRNSLGYLLRMQSPGISCRPTVSKALRVGPQESVLKSTLHVFLMHIKVGEPLAFLSFCINWHLPVCGWYSVPVDLTGTEMCKPGTRPVLIPCAIWRCGLHTLEMLYPVISMSTPLSLYHPLSCYIILGLTSFLDSSSSPAPPEQSHISLDSFTIAVMISDCLSPAQTHSLSFSPTCTTTCPVPAFGCPTVPSNPPGWMELLNLPEHLFSLHYLSWWCCHSSTYNPRLFPFTLPPSMSKPCWFGLLNIPESIISQ